MAKSSEVDFIRWFRVFVRESRKGKRRQKNGERIRSGTIDFYEVILLNLEQFQAETGFPLKLNIQVNRSRVKTKQVSQYYKEFYFRFTRYLTVEKGNYDNYAGTCWKCIRTFFNWMKQEKLYSVGTFHHQFYITTEKVPLVTLAPERLQFLLYNEEFQAKLPLHLMQSLEIFLVGCATGLRFGDLIRLQKSQLVHSHEGLFLKNISQKTETATLHKLPGFAREIVTRRLSTMRKTVFAKISLDRFNTNLKSIAELAGWTEEFPKYRKQQGIKVPIYKDKKTRQHYRFCDLISSHAMRRTNITSLLCLGMDEMSVRRISGHSAGSKEFYKYVNFAQAYLDQEVETAFLKLKKTTEI